MLLLTLFSTSLQLDYCWVEQPSFANRFYEYFLKIIYHTVGIICKPVLIRLKAVTPLELWMQAEQWLLITASWEDVAAIVFVSNKFMSSCVICLVIARAPALCYDGHLIQNLLCSQINGSESWQCLRCRKKSLPFFLTDMQQQRLSPGRGAFPFTEKACSTVTGVEEQLSKKNFPIWNLQNETEKSRPEINCCQYCKNKCGRPARKRSVKATKVKTACKANTATEMKKKSYLSYSCNPRFFSVQKRRKNLRRERLGTTAGYGKEITIIRNECFCLKLTS